MPASASWAWRFWASLTERRVLALRHDGVDRHAVRHAGGGEVDLAALSRSRVGHGRAVGVGLVGRRRDRAGDLALAERRGVEHLLAVDGALDGEAHVEVVEGATAGVQLEYVVAELRRRRDGDAVALGLLGDERVVEHRHCTLPDWSADTIDDSSGMTRNSI